MDQVTQQNAALVEQASAAASLQQQAATLAQVVRALNLAQHLSYTGAPAANPARRTGQATLALR